MLSDIFYFQINSLSCNDFSWYQWAGVWLSTRISQIILNVAFNAQVWTLGWSSLEKEWDIRNSLTHWTRSMELSLAIRQRDSSSDLNSRLPFLDRYGRYASQRLSQTFFVRRFLIFFLLYYRALSDTDSDGKMNINEFSIACKLINLKLRGFEIPKVLPPVLIQSLKSFSIGRWIVLCAQETSRSYNTRYFRRC